MTVANPWYLHPLCQASYEGHRDVVEFLLDKGVDANVDSTFGEKLGKNSGNGLAYDLSDRKALYLASAKNEMEIIKLLLSRGAKNSSLYYSVHTATKNNALHAAAERGHADVVATLLKSGVNVDDRNENLETALHVAAHGGSEKVWKLLLDNGADVEARSQEVLTPLHSAATMYEGVVVDLLLKSGANPEALTDEKQTYQGLLNVVFIEA